jgi:Flp pilus assembly protein TadD
VHRAEDALAAGRPAAVIAGTAGLERRSVLARAERLRALAELQRGDLPAAERAVALAVQASPDDWSLQLDHAVLLRRLGRRAEAGRAYGVALTLNPLLVVPPGFSR